MLAVPTPPCRPPAPAPVPAPTDPHRRWSRRAPATARRPNAASGRCAEVAAPAEVEDHRRRHDGHDRGGSGIRRTDGKPSDALLEPGHHPVGGGQPVRAATGEADGVDLLDEVVRRERVGLPGARAAATHVDARCGTVRGEHHGGAGLPAPPDALVVADPDAGDVGDRAERQRSRGRGHRRETRWRDWE